jgi:hypothetical protein
MGNAIKEHTEPLNLLDDIIRIARAWTGCMEAFVQWIWTLKVPLEHYGVIVSLFVASGGSVQLILRGSLNVTTFWWIFCHIELICADVCRLYSHVFQVPVV